jgi:hypothetical protein
MLLMMNAYWFHAHFITTPIRYQSFRQKLSGENRGVPRPDAGLARDPSSFCPRLEQSDAGFVSLPAGCFFPAKKREKHLRWIEALRR